MSNIRSNQREYRETAIRYQDIPRLRLEAKRSRTFGIFGWMVDVWKLRLSCSVALIVSPKTTSGRELSQNPNLKSVPVLIQASPWTTCFKKAILNICA